jgi:hypothetical protein
VIADVYEWLAVAGDDDTLKQTLLTIIARNSFADGRGNL